MTSQISNPYRLSSRIMSPWLRWNSTESLPAVTEANVLRPQRGSMTANNDSATELGAAAAGQRWPFLAAAACRGRGVYF